MNCRWHEQHIIVMDEIVIVSRSTWLETELLLMRNPRNRLSMGHNTMEARPLSLVSLRINCARSPKAQIQAPSRAT